MTGIYEITKPFDPRQRIMPTWLYIKVGNVRERAPKTDTEVPDDVATQRVRDYLRSAPLAIEGAGGDHTTFTVAARCKDLGADETLALGLLLEEWNDRCSPPWSPEELETKVQNAYRYSEEGVGSKSPEHDFTPFTEDDGNIFESVPTRPPFTIAPASFPSVASIPPRRWLLGHHLLVHKVAVTIAPPGAGKSTWSLAMALAVITGRKTLTGLDVHERGNVLAINNEDDQDELDRRLAAVMMHYGISFDALRGKLFSYSGVHRPFIMAGRAEAGVRPIDRDALIEQIKANDIKLVIVDPFLETHEVDENNNEEINKVARMYREVAVEADCAVLIIHHTRKAPAGSSEGHAGNMESGRGASSLSGVARIMNTLYNMSEKDADAYGVAQAERHLYVRLDDAKANLSLATNQARWYKKVSITLPNGDDVGVLEPVELSLAADTEREAWLAALARGLAENGSGELTVRQAADLILDDPMLGIGLSNQSVMDRLKKLLSRPQIAAGWEIWYEHDPQRAEGRQRATHWIFGRRELEALDPL